MCPPCDCSLPKSRASPAPSPRRSPGRRERAARTSSAARATSSRGAQGTSCRWRLRSATARRTRPGDSRTCPSRRATGSSRSRRPSSSTSIRRLLRRTRSASSTRATPIARGSSSSTRCSHFLGYRGPVDRLLVRDLSLRGRAPAARRARAQRQVPTALRVGARAPARRLALRHEHDAPLHPARTRRRATTACSRSGACRRRFSGSSSRATARSPISARPVLRRGAEDRAGGRGELPRGLGPADGADLDDEGRLRERGVAEAVPRRGGASRARHACTEERKTRGAPAALRARRPSGRRGPAPRPERAEPCSTPARASTRRIASSPIRARTAPTCPKGTSRKRGTSSPPSASSARPSPPPSRKADLTLRSRAWNDTKVSAHHAIIPTPAAGAPRAPLTDDGARRLRARCRRYLAQFYPPHEFLQTAPELEVAGERFAASGRQVLALGWKAPRRGLRRRPTRTPEDEESETRRPCRRSGRRRRHRGRRHGHGQAHPPPKPFNDASLIAAMCGVAKFVRDPAVKKILTEADGIGTPATRAAIIETLFERGYVERSRGPSSRPRPAARSLPACPTSRPRPS